MSMGALLLAGGAHGQAHGAAELEDPDPPGLGAASRARRRTSRSRRARVIAIKRRLEEIIAKHTGQPLEKVAKDMERDYFMTAQEAKEYGIIDTVIAHRASGDGGWRNTRSDLREEQGERHGPSDRRQRAASLQLLRQEPAAGQEADRRSRRLHLRRVHRSLQRDHRRGADRSGPARPRQPSAPEGDLRRPERLRRRAGGGEADALGRRLQPLQARADGGRRAATSSCRSRTSCCSARPAAARRCSRRRSRGSSTSRSRSPTRPRSPRRATSARTSRTSS